MERQVPLGTVLRKWGRLGLTGFGGPGDDHRAGRRLPGLGSAGVAERRRLAAAAGTVAAIAGLPVPATS
jgi:hypothetical protein